MRAWPQDHIDELKKLVGEGLSFAQSSAAINAKFGTSYSRNACIGKSVRLGLSAGKTVKRDAVEHRIAVRAMPRKRVTQLPLRPRPRRNLTPDAVVPLHLNLLGLGREQCHWPYGDGPFTFCGCRCFDGSSYCEGHLAASVGDGTRSEQMADRIPEAAE